jgi:hypothetical protein
MRKKSPAQPSIYCMKQEEFIKLFDANIDKLFQYYYTQTQDRVIAMRLAESAFKKAWDMVQLKRDRSEVRRMISVPKGNEYEYSKATVISFNTKQYGY